MPATNGEKFTRLAELDVLSTTTADQLREAAGFRNVLAHNYGGDIDDSPVFYHLQDDLGWFLDFLQEIRDDLRSR